MKRRGLSKRTRFEIFKRDGFECQYCGAHPPQVILHVDHIVAVANGGDNDYDNLLTACQDCNLGKSSKELTDAPISLLERAAEIQERERQIVGYQQVLASRRQRIREEVQHVVELYETFHEGYTLTDRAKLSVQHFVERLGFDDVYQSMEAAHRKPQVSDEEKFRYFCGTCWAKIRAL